MIQVLEVSPHSLTKPELEPETLRGRGTCAPGVTGVDHFPWAAPRTGSEPLVRAGQT